jgi:hypothetical protein
MNTPTTAEEMWATVMTLREEVIRLRGEQHTERIKMKEPEPFSGERDKLRGFLTQMRAYQRFHMKHTATEASKVLHAASYLRGQALAWFEPRMRDYLENTDEAKDESTRAMFNDYDEFEERLKKVFGDTDEERKAERELARLRQTNSVSTYAATFRQITSSLDWEDEPLMARFYEGLKDIVKDELIKMDRPGRLTEYIEMAVKIDERLYERRMERGGQRSTTTQWTRSTKFHKHTNGKKQRYQKREVSYGDPMELDTAQRKTTEGGCFGCGKEGHFKRDCPESGNNRRWRKPWRKVPETPRKSVALTTKKDLEEKDARQTEGPSHAALSWTACYDDGCMVHYGDKNGSGWWPRQTRKTKSLCVLERKQMDHDPMDDGCGCQLCEASFGSHPIHEEQPEKTTNNKSAETRKICIVKAEDNNNACEENTAEDDSDTCNKEDAEETQTNTKNRMQACAEAYNDSDGYDTEPATQYNENGIPYGSEPWQYTKTRIFRAPIEKPGGALHLCQFEGPYCGMIAYSREEDLRRHHSLHFPQLECPYEGCCRNEAWKESVRQHLMTYHPGYGESVNFEQRKN